MNLHEYQAKQLLAQYGVSVPAGEVCQTPDAARKAAEQLLSGGAKLLKTAAEVEAAAKAMLGNILVTKQTGPEGRLVSKLLIAAAPNIQKELYLAVLLDRTSSRTVMMASTEGGMDIEEVAAKTPEKIIRESIDPAVGMMPYQARKLGVALGLTGDLISQGA